MVAVPQALQLMTMISYLFFHWKGAMDHQSIQFKIFVNRNHITQVKEWYLIYYVDGSNTLMTQQLPLVQTLAPILVKLDNLQPMTKYKYFFFYDSLNHLNAADIPTKFEVFQFKTLQTPYQKQNLSFSFSSCAKTGSEDPVFQNIMDLFPDHQFFLQMGDIFYGDIVENSEILYDESYYRMFESKAQSKFYQYYTIVYIWDDHDFGDNNSGESSPSKEAATNVFLKNVLYYPLRALPSDIPQSFADKDGVYQYVIAGQTLIVIMDLRTHYRDGERAMDQYQLNWLMLILDWCKSNSQLDNLVIVSSIPWLGKDWVSFTDQRTQIGAKLAEVMKVKQNVLMITGDSHMIAFDNGYNNDAGGFPHCISSPMDKTPSCKGGKYTFGPFSGNSQYSTLDITYDQATNQNCFIVRGLRNKDLLYQYNSCNEQDKKLKMSNECFTSVASIFLVSILPLVFVVVVLIVLWRYNIKFTTSLQRNNLVKVYVDMVQQDKEEHNMLNADSPGKLNVPSISIKGNSEQKLNFADNDLYAKSPYNPSNSSQMPMFYPSSFNKTTEKQENKDNK